MLHEIFESDIENSDTEFDDSFDQDLYKDLELNTVFEKSTDFYCNLKDILYNDPDILCNLRSSADIIQLTSDPLFMENRIKNFYKIYSRKQFINWKLKNNYILHKLFIIYQNDILDYISYTPPSKKKFFKFCFIYSI